MEVLHLIYHQFVFTANSLGRQPTTSQYFQPLVPQTLALVAAAIHCVLSEYDTGKKATVMLSQDEYRGTFYESPVIHFTLEATALINHTLVVCFKPPPFPLSPSPPRGATLLGSALLNPSWCFSALIHSLLYPSEVNSSSFSTPPRGLALLDPLYSD